MKDFNMAYKTAVCAHLEEPAKKVVGAMGRAMWHFAQIKEITWYCWGFEGITNAIHYLEHIYGDFIDDFKALMAQMGLPLTYPTIPAYSAKTENLTAVFMNCIELIDEVNAAVSNFIEAADTSYSEPLARQAESIQVANFKNRAWLTQALTMSEQGGSIPTIDAWLKNTMVAPQNK